MHTLELLEYPSSGYPS